MMKLAVFLAVVAVATAQVSRTPITSFEAFGAAVDKKTQPHDLFVGMKSASEGWSFLGATDETVAPVCMNVVDDSRDCYQFSEGCSPDCDYCVEVNECYDPTSKRCKRIVDCPCNEGTLTCLPYHQGVTFGNMSTAGAYTDRFDLVLESNSYALIARESCAEDDSFNIVPCRLNDEDCESFEPCTSDESELGCCFLLPYPVPEFPVSSSTASSTMASSTMASSTMASTV
eukprot:m.59840 g.59840  ORF g.59840 m.59840 type:complete len:229 (+) comp11786_c0_seq1:801-1487(+)